MEQDHPIPEEAIEQKPTQQDFSESEKAVIEEKRKVLSSLAYFIGKDFNIPVELNEPGQGWYWDFKKNEIRIDPVDLAEKPMDHLRFVICHEGGHRRISRTEFIPEEVWKQPGFSFMMNAVEDPRDNNFVADSYPRFRDQMEGVYQQQFQEMESEAAKSAKEKLGFIPRFQQAGFELIKQWFLEQQGEEPRYTEGLPPEVREAVEKMLEAASDSWWQYPSKEEADSSEELIRKYSESVYRNNLENIWPDFKKLVDMDREDEAMAQYFKGQSDTPEELGQELTDEEKAALDEALEKVLEGETGEGGQPIDLDSLTEELKQKIKDYIDSLPEEEKQKFREKAEQSLADHEKSMDQELEGKLSQHGEEKQGGEEKPQAQEQPTVPAEIEEQLQKYREKIEKEVKTDHNRYEKYRREVLPIIDSLEQDLREIFVARRAGKWDTGYKTGTRINIKRRMQEKAKGVSAVESKAWQRRELPQEKDYAVSLLVDLSGSMGGEKIEETFKGVVVLSEVLNRLSIQTEILGFNQDMFEYQKFGEDMNQQIRERMGQMLDEPWISGYNTDAGWALEQASERLGKQKAAEKFLLVLTDGMPMESPMHPRRKYELGSIVQKVMDETDQKLVGLGVGPYTEFVSDYYPNSIADVNVQEMSEQLADLIREAIANFDKFQ